jgi:hypothetical protein
LILSKRFQKGFLVSQFGFFWKYVVLMVIAE